MWARYIRHSYYLIFFKSFRKLWIILFCHSVSSHVVSFPKISFRKSDNRQLLNARARIVAGSRILSVSSKSCNTFNQSRASSRTCGHTKCKMRMTNRCPRCHSQMPTSHSLRKKKPHTSFFPISWFFIAFLVQGHASFSR